MSLLTGPLNSVSPVSPFIPPMTERPQSKVQSPHHFVAWALPISSVSSPIACISDPKPQLYSLLLILYHSMLPSFKPSWGLLLFLSPAQMYFHYKIFPDISQKGNYSLWYSTCSLIILTTLSLLRQEANTNYKAESIQALVSAEGLLPSS